MEFHTAVICRKGQSSLYNIRAADLARFDDPQGCYGTLYRVYSCPQYHIKAWVWWSTHELSSRLVHLHAGGSFGLGRYIRETCKSKWSTAIIVLFDDFARLTSFTPANPLFNSRLRVTFDKKLIDWLAQNDTKRVGAPVVIAK